MATYKLIQDIEAEDKILGPLTLRQFIFALIAVFFLYICFFCLTKGVFFLLILFLPPALFFGFFALPFGRDQPTELWALAKLRFWFKPRRRIWNQSGVKELVTITVPKKIERVLTDGLSKNEVQSRLRALANTIDSRGWAIKNVGASSYAPYGSAALDGGGSDRLIAFDNLPQEVPTYQVPAAADIMDPDNNPIARQFDTMIAQSAQSRHQLLINQLNAAPAVVAVGAGLTGAASGASGLTVGAGGTTYDWTAPSPSSGFSSSAPYPAPASVPSAVPAASVTVQQANGSADPWFLLPSQPLDETTGVGGSAGAGVGADAGADFSSASAGSTTTRADDKQAEAELSSELKAHATAPHISYGNLRTLQPLKAQPASPLTVPSPPPPAGQTTAATTRTSAPTSTTVTAPSDPAILSLSANNDLNVATLAREAQRKTQKGQRGDPAADEVVISLH
jgi:hypothetical protein